MGMAVKLFFCKSNNKIKKKKVEGKVFYEKNEISVGHMGDRNKNTTSIKNQTGNGFDKSTSF